MHIELWWGSVRFGGSHGDEDYRGLLRCDTVECCGKVPTFRRTSEMLVSYRNTTRRRNQKTSTWGNTLESDQLKDRKGDESNIINKYII
jgi:hypothetical protein